MGLLLVVSPSPTRGWRAPFDRTPWPKSSVSKRPIERPPRWFWAFGSTPGAHGASPVGRPATPTFVSRRRRCRSLAVLRGSVLGPLGHRPWGLVSANHRPGSGGAGFSGGTTLTHPLPRPSRACGAGFHRRVDIRASRRPRARRPPGHRTPLRQTNASGRRPSCERGWGGVCGRMRGRGLDFCCARWGGRGDDGGFWAG